MTYLNECVFLLRFIKYIFVLFSGEQKQITTNRRARQIAIAPDGSKLAFISSANGKTELALLNFECIEIVRRPDRAL